MSTSSNHKQTLAGRTSGVVQQPVLTVEKISFNYQVSSGDWLHRKHTNLRALDAVSFDLHRAETLGVVGESGSGKSTLARVVLGLLHPDEGKVCWRGEILHELDAEQLRSKRKELQLVFQDPQAALNPRMTIGEILAEPLHTFYSQMAPVQVRERVRGMLKMVGILPNQVNRYAHEFSGGQCQRIGIARALILNPRLLVCDEPVSALDVSIQAQIIHLLQDLQRKLQLSMIFIAHDLSVVRYISDRVLVMYLGQVMELAACDELYAKPLHPYTKALIQSVPLPDPDLERAHTERGLRGEPPSPLNPPAGCPFSARCPYAVDRCHQEKPLLRPFDNRLISCHRVEELVEQSDLESKDQPAV